MTRDRQTSLDILADALAELLAATGEDLSAIVERLPRDLHADGVDVLANVMHYVADADIRSQDDEYRNMQAAQMRGLIQALRRGEPRDELLSYSFLSRRR